MDLGLEGKRALVTGASRGIGAAVARSLAQEGCDLDLAARDRTALERFKAELQELYKVEVRIHALDMRERGACAHLAREAGDVDILVNNAGDVPHGGLLDIDEERWRTGWDLKVFGYINLTREIYRAMVDRRRGTVVNVVGTAGERPLPTRIAAATANASLLAFSRALAGESAKFGVRVNTVNPGPTETDRQVVRWKGRAMKQFGDESRWREFTQPYPFGRLARPDEIASVVAFLASERASYMSGAVVTVDGGGDL